MMQCRKYNSHDLRVTRCKDLKLCSCCTSSRHVKEKCPRELDYVCVCQAKDHVSALCPKFKFFKSNTNLSFSSSSDLSGTYLLPTFTI